MQSIPQRNWLYLLFIFSIIFFGCKSHLTKEIESTYEDGNPKVIKYYQGEAESKLVVKEIQYYPNGEVKLQGVFEKGKKDGQWIFYYENGKIWSQGFFKLGLRTGKTLVYHENGQLFYEGAYIEGKKQGTWNFYDQDGELVNKVIFDSGKVISPSNKSNPIKDSSLIE